MPPPQLVPGTDWDPGTAGFRGCWIMVHNIVVNVLRGRIELEDPEGGGARFVVELPAVVPRRDDEPADPAR